MMILPAHKAILNRRSGIWRIASFWFLQLAGWGLLWSAYLAMVRMAGVNEPGITAGLALTQFCGLIATSGLRYVYRAMRRRKYPLGALIWRVLLASVVTAHVWGFLGALPAYLHRGETSCLPDSWLEYGAILFQQTFIILAWSALYFSIRTWQDWRHESRRAEEAIRLRDTTELQMLRYQLNPHFLFNALNSVRALIEEDKETAKTAITELSEFLRYSLTSRAETTVPLKDELQALRHYFSIQKIRYENRLEVQWAIDPLAEDYPVLSFLLQPLVENAVKYGMETSVMPLRIRIAAERLPDRFRLTVSNSGRWITPNTGAGSGVGLENVQKRLANAYSNRVEFSSNETDGWVHVRIGIRT
jgi:hypothetical protein